MTDFLTWLCLIMVVLQWFECRKGHAEQLVITQLASRRRAAILTFTVAVSGIIEMAHLMA